MRKLLYCLLAISFILAGNFIYAQCGGSNLLLNPGFESPVVSNVNGNNVQPGTVWGNWTVNFSGGINVIRVDGTGYLPGYSTGPDVAADNATGGKQYIDIASAAGTLSQSFTLASPAVISFAGSFSNRESASGTYVPWSAFIQILDGTSTQVAISNTINFTASQGDKSWFTAMGTSGTLPAGTYTFRATVGDYGHFDKASVCNNSALPVNLESFTASQQGKNVMINWTASNELNLSHFEIQSATDAINFSTIGSKDARNSFFYSFLDANPGKKMLYYRLKSVDIDRKFSYSKILKVSLSGAGNLGAYPNPAKTNLFIACPASILGKSGIISIVGADGKLLFQKQVTSFNETENLDISTISNGIYHLLVRTDEKLFNHSLAIIK